MRYLCLIYTEERQLRSLDSDERTKLLAEWVAVNDVMHNAGHLLASETLAPVEAAVTLRRREGALLVTDGPFANTKEQLGGFCLLEARDLNEAILLAGRLPPARYGSVEVRPVPKDKGMH